MFISTFNEKIYSHILMCVCVCARAHLYVRHIHVTACGGQKRVSDFLETDIVGGCELLCGTEILNLGPLQVQ